MNINTVISLFAGCGGSTLGYKWAGFKELLAIEWDDNAVETFKLNFKTPIWKKDIMEVTGQEILEFCKIKKGELDILDGSPPCQGFSAVGRREITDNRNELYKEQIRLVNELQPKVFVMENVAGVARGKMKGNFKQIMLELKATGYNIKCKLMNSKYYQVPQSRQRLIWIGVRPDLNKDPSYPEPFKKLIPVREALKGIKTTTAVYLKPEWGTSTLWDQTKTGKSLAQSVKTKNGTGYSFLKLNPDKPSNTITKSLEIGNKRWCAHLHWQEKRTLSIEEIKRLSSFPDNFKLVGNIQEQWARIGNAVMPKFMYYIARHIKENILTNK